MPWQVVFDHRSSFRPHVNGTPPSDTNFATVYTADTTQNNPNTPGNYHFWLTRHFDTNDYPDGTYHSKSKQATSAATRERPPSR